MRLAALVMRLGALALVGCLLAGCTSQHGSGGDLVTISLSRGTGASEPSGLAGGDGETAPPSSTPSLSAPHDVREVAGTCPYISAQAFADAEGDRVGRVTVLQSRPVGCRFYFQYNSGQLVGEITVEVFGTPTEAYNAMVLSARGHPEVQSYPDVGDGAVAYQTPLRGSPAWQCVFAQGRSVVTVRTQQPYPALNAVNLAREIVPKFK
jgi:hypothetical protein